MEFFYLLKYYFLLCRFYSKKGEFHLNESGYSLRYKEQGVAFIFYKEMLSFKILCYRMNQAFREMNEIEKQLKKSKED